YILFNSIINVLKERDNKDDLDSLIKLKDFSKLLDYFSKIAYDELFNEAQKEFNRKKTFHPDAGEALISRDLKGLLRFIPEELLGTDIFKLKLMNCNDSVFTEIITADLLKKINLRLDKDKDDWARKAEMIPASVMREIYNPKLKPKMEFYVPNKVAPSKAEIDTVVSPGSLKAEITQSDLEKELKELNAPKKKAPIKPFNFTEKKTMVVEAVKSQPETALKVRYHQPKSGSSYWDWFNGLNQVQSNIVKAHLNHLTERQKGVKSLGGGLYELKINQFKGLRIYFKYTGTHATIIMGGDKKSQAADIVAARAVAKSI
ncbi:MAG: hypothetical protein JHC93_08275, partial [Parachlamydiales bacterium]|nr:hypothetical protein [Parachlamydiales bacterium]